MDATSEQAIMGVMFRSAAVQLRTRPTPFNRGYKHGLEHHELKVLTLHDLSEHNPCDLIHLIH